MTVAAVLLDAETPSTRYIVGGVPLLTRHILDLHRLGVSEFYLMGCAERPEAARHRRIPSDVVLHAVSCAPHADVLAQLCALPRAPQEVLVLQSQWLIDPRLLRTLLATSHPQWLPSPDPTASSPIAARLQLTPGQHGETTPQALGWPEDQRLDPLTLDTYSPAHRGPVAFYQCRIETRDDAVAATQTLITSSRKTTMDVIASTLDWVFVNRLVFWLSYTRITPNQVTLATGVLGAIVSLLFLSGWMRLGALLTYAAVTLDGVDGKLARATLQFSRLGELEHVLDFFMEQAWYLTITIYLVRVTGEQALWWIGGSLMGCDLLIKILYGCGRLLFGKQLEELGDFDRTFRRIGGRRNIYMAILLIGFWSGFPQQALMVALAWAVITLAVHGSRMVYHFSQRKATSPA